VGTWKSSWRAPQEGQNRARALMRSPQFGQKVVSGVATVGAYGYHLRPMKVLVIGDMEGVAGICRWNQVMADAVAYQEGRHLYTGEMNAAARGAFAAGATEVVLMDCHGAGGDRSFHSLIPAELDERVDFVVQTHWTEYTELLEQGCDVALFVGQHARAGNARGVMSHTVSSTQWQNLRFNGALVGEVGINAALCGTWGCPVALVTGDDAVCDEARDLLGAGLRTTPVKIALGRFAARHLSSARACREIEAAAQAAVEDRAGAPVYDPGAPCTIEVQLAAPDHAVPYRSREGVELTDPRTVTITAPTWWQAWRRLYL
jgi:D-amino peptidase